MYKYYPHRGDRMRTRNNIKKEDIVEDIGMSIPRIYVALKINK
jgi:hypothetical protein